MNNFVINVKENKKRQEHIKIQFQNIEFSFFEAITPTNLKEILDNNLPNLHNSILSPVEKACFMSHFLLIKKCVDDNLPYITIFEDDVFLNQDAKLFLNDDKWLFDNFNLEEKIVIKLETKLSELLLEKTEIKFNNYNFEKIKSKNNGCGAYIISNSASKYFLKLLNQLSENPLIKPIDDILFEDLIKDKNFKFYQINPAICIQDIILNQEQYSLTSHLETERELSNQKRKELYYKTRGLSGRLKKVFHNILRVFLKMKHKKNFVIVPFDYE